MNIRTIDATQIQGVIYSSENPVCIFFACEDCLLSSIIHIRLKAVALEYRQWMSVVKVNCKDYDRVLKSHGIETIPTLLFYKNGSEISRLEGLAQSYELEIYVRQVTEL